LRTRAKRGARSLSANTRMFTKTPKRLTVSRRHLLIKMLRALTFANTRTLIKTPRVLEEARIHFACSTLEGVEIEDDGGPG
jgi:hypothetical protein